MSTARRSLVERDQHLARLARALTLALEGEGMVVSLTSPVGTGRTQLLSAFAQQVRGSGAVHLRAVGSRMERNLPLSLLVQLFQHAPLDEAAAKEVCRLMTGAVRAVEEDRTARLSVAVLHGLADAILTLAERKPLVISVDDVQYGDRHSLECLLYLARRMQGHPLLVVLGEREFEVWAHALFDAELQRLEHHERLPLGLLSPASRPRGRSCPPRPSAGRRARTA